MAADLGNARDKAGYDIKVMVGGTECSMYQDDLESQKPTKAGTFGQMIQTELYALGVQNWLKESGYDVADVTDQPVYMNTAQHIWYFPFAKWWGKCGSGMTASGIPARTVVRYVGVMLTKAMPSPDAALQDAQARLDAAKIASQQAEIERQIKLEQAKATAQVGGGIRPVEVTIFNNGTQIFVAKSPAESAGAGSPHAGMSIIDPGSWEAASGGMTPAALGVPGAFLAWQEASGATQVAKEEIDSLKQAAQAGYPGPQQALKDINIAW